MKIHQKLTVKLTSTHSSPEKLNPAWCGFSNRKSTSTHIISKRVQDVYAEKLIKKYAISINQKTFTSLSYQSLISYMREVDSIRIYTYRQKVKSICYLAIITRSDIAKIASKLAKFLINSDFYHLMIADHCIRYLHVTRHLTIKFDVFEDEKLIIQIN